MRQGEGQKQWKARKRAEWLAQGLCQRCGKQPFTKGTTCDECRRTIAENTKKYRQRAKARLRMRKLRAERRAKTPPENPAANVKPTKARNTSPRRASAGPVGGSGST